jgi:DNA helicase II / ATP-dependent DNA helicase PcrA
MDAFDTVRLTASRLHEKLVAAGADPLKPALLVDAAIRDLELELCWLAPGDPALKGAHALFDEQSGTICCENVGEPGERAALVGHEIGHACVHAGSAMCSDSDIDASRSTEAAPVGLQRVEEYGARERRELQANVFAREFLFPRTLARLLYIEQGLGASAIAERTGLPKNLIRQQLFDALLLPPAPAVEENDRPPVPALRPDPSQDRAVKHRGSPFQLQAGPGTGKTRTLVKTVLALLEEGVHPSAILILTFSNRAAGELSERIAAVAPSEAARIWMGTFHAFGLDLLRRNHEKLGLPAQPVLFDRSDAIEVMQEILPTLPLNHYSNLWDPALVLRDIVAAISRAKDELADPVRYRSFAEEMLRKAGDEDDRVAAEKCLEVARLYELYEAALGTHGAVDFGDLIMRPTLLLESDAALQAAVRLRHRHVLVDEYQDVNRASTRLLKALAGDGKRLWVVGDARQSIYRFRGASSTNMTAFSQEYPNAAADQLSISYRSTEQIVDAVVAIAPHMGASAGMLPLALTADRGSGPSCPEIRRYETLDDELGGIAGSVRELEARGVRLRDQAVLCRTNSRLNEIASALEARGIPVLHLGSLFERDEIRDLLALLSLAVDPFGNGLVRLGAMPRYNVSLQDVYIATKWLRTSERSFLTALPELAQLPGLSPEGVEGLKRAANDCEGIGIASSAWELLSHYLLDCSDLLREMWTRSSVPERMRAVAMWQFLNFVREQSPGSARLPIQRVLDRVRQLVLLAEERDLRQVPAGALHLDAVRLMTAHGSKGLEFEAVHVPGLTVASFPSSNRGQRCPPPVGMIDGTDGLSVSEEARRAHEHEEQCLFFVAVSRARTNLVLHLARRQPNGKNRSPSGFLSWIPANLSLEVAQPAALPLPPDAPRPVPITIIRPGDWHVTDSQLGLYERCPRRFFYTHILDLGGARKSTAFSRTHDCLYELIGWLADARRGGDHSLEAAEKEFENIWNMRGPVDHGFAADYRRLAAGLVAALVRAGAGRRFRDAEPLAIDFPSGRVVVEPNEIAELPDGAIVLRRVRTGHKRGDEYDRLDYALYHLAGQARFGTRYAVEALHLTDETVEIVTLSTQKLRNRQDKSEQMLSSLSAGWFPPEIDTVTCPRCPHFFICPAAANGPVTLG